MAAVLAGNQHELIGDGSSYGLVFGTLSTKYLTTTHPSIESDDAGIVNDSQRLREDGIRHGEDWVGAKSVGFEVAVITDRDPDPEESNADALEAFEAEWTHPKWREEFGRYAVLRSRMKQGRVRRAYGRPRRFAAVEDGLAKKGHSTFLADFLVSDGKWYDDDLSQVRTPNGVTTLRQTTMTTSGSRDAWLTVHIYGQCTSPRVIVGGADMNLQNLEVPAGQWVTIDARPWSREIARSHATTPVVPTYASTQLKNFRVAPAANHLVSYSAAAMANDSYAIVQWRNTWTRW